MDNARMICYGLSKLEQDRGETILLALRELEGIRPQDILAEIAKLNGTRSESPNQELPKLPSHTEPVRRIAELSRRHCGDNRQGVNLSPNEQAHALGAHLLRQTGMPQAQEERLRVALELELVEAYVESSTTKVNHNRR